MAKQHERTFARRMALMALYQCLVSPDLVVIPDEDEETGVRTIESTCAQRIEEAIEADVELPDEGHLPPYAKQLLAGVAGQMDHIDGLLAEASENWSVERMPLVDHGILLLGVSEMLNADDVPVSVSINEAVELAKAFGGEDESARFVNGLLGRIARTHCASRLEEEGAGVALDDDEGADVALDDEGADLEPDDTLVEA